MSLLRHYDGATIWCDTCGRGREYFVEPLDDSFMYSIGRWISDVNEHEAYLKAKRELHPGCTL